MSQIQGYHAHVYFDADTIEQARALCEAAAEKFGVVMGRIHERQWARMWTGVANWHSTMGNFQTSCCGWRSIVAAWWC